MGCNCISNCQRCTSYVERLEDEITRLKGQISEMVEKAAAKSLDGYRELGARAARAEIELGDNKAMLVRIHDALDCAMGDTDPETQGMTDDEIRSEEPILWAAKEVAGLIGSGPTDRFRKGQP